MEKRKPTIGEAMRKIDCAVGDHMSTAWYQLMKALGHPERAQETPNAKGFAVGSAEYHTAAVFEYMREAHEIMAQNMPTEWQLCPYQDCCWGCGVENGWNYAECPHCHRLFSVHDTDSDYEDIHLKKCAAIPENERRHAAWDYGPSWASPDESLGVIRQ